MESLLFQVVYISTAAEMFTRAKLTELLKSSVQRNTETGITGMLLYKDGTFMQVLEGDQAAVTALYAKISRDPRHHHVIPLLKESIPERQFPDSAMAFRDLAAAELRNLPGYSEFLNTPLNGDLFKKDLSKCQKLLLLFKRNIR